MAGCKMPHSLKAELQRWQVENLPDSLKAELQHGETYAVRAITGAAVKGGTTEARGGGPRSGMA